MAKKNSHNVWDMIGVQKWGVDELKPFMKNGGNVKDTAPTHDRPAPVFGKRPVVKHEPMELVKAKFDQITHLSVIFTVWYKTPDGDTHQGNVYLYMSSNGDLYAR